ncbi:hypothetical protein [uncultured Thiodictyon sp.]|jgi:hypothetical protein|uniref:hypothetical protein n=1 Tax=uncultured Thiodictyon sp. TaxID=1846217 RepID=UPI0025FE8A16|nr:hypothetical protein [uncultured Thiodictyon sp.]
MRCLFAATFYRIAVSNPRDQAQARAITLSTTLQPAQIITTDEVLTQFFEFQLTIHERQARIGFAWR